MDVVMIFKYGKRFRYAPSFNEMKGSNFRKKEIHSMGREINLKSKVRLNTGGCQFYKDIKDQFYPSE